MTLGRSQEVLLHHGEGKITPVAVRVGVVNDLVEIQQGLPNIANVVRDLETLCRLNARIRALMSGFWSP
jgi:hypothetical protein